MRLNGLALVMIAACYRPSPETACAISCASGACPSGLTCTAGLCVGADGTCGGGGESDGGTDGGGSADAQECFGQGLFSLCFPGAPPSGATVLNGIIDTSQGTGCTHATQPRGSGPQDDLCFVVAADLFVNTGTVLRAIGSQPLVLIASDTITIDGTIDVSSQLDDGVVHPPLGAGANDWQCTVIAASTANAGGTGGSYGTSGGQGGASSMGGTGGGAAMPVSPLVIRGGCGGSDGHGGTTNSLGGASGGAIYLIAGGRIAGSATGVINASGAASFAGASKNTVGGGGGGGAGGLIGFDAPVVSFMGTAIANGAGGASGGDQNSGVGSSGSDPNPLFPGIAASGGPMTADGGTGGSGSVDNGPGQSGGGVSTASGGGGGGGAGVIRLVPIQSVTFTASPPPT